MLQPTTVCSDFYVQFRVTQQATVASRQTGCAVDKVGRTTSAACDGAATSESIPAAAAAGAVTTSSVAAAAAKAAGGGSSGPSSSTACDCAWATQAAPPERASAACAPGQITGAGHRAAAATPITSQCRLGGMLSGGRRAGGTSTKVAYLLAPVLQVAGEGGGKHD